MRRRFKFVAALLIMMFASPAGFSRSSSPDSSIYDGIPSAKLARLNYPQIPASSLARSVKRPLGTKADSGMANEWGLVNIGFFDVFTPLVQPIHPSHVKTCSRHVVIAVVDTGVDYTHPELRDNLWINEGEVGPWESKKISLSSCRDKSCNGIDDDGNGFADDVIGWDFVNDIPLPFDTHGHGTHIAGIISSAAANGVGAAGVCPGASIMALKYYDNSGLGYNNLTNTVRAIEYATRMGAQIINYSGGGSDPAPAEKAAIETALRKGILFVAAAGNDGHDNMRTAYYPASYSLENIIGVASVNRENLLLPSSNYGKSVHVAAPGLSIFSTLPNSRFGTMTGTSQATAFVTGLAALVISQQPSTEFDFRAVKSYILKGVKPLPSQDARAVAAGLVSVPLTLKAAREGVTTPSLATTVSTKKTPR